MNVRFIVLACMFFIWYVNVKKKNYLHMLIYFFNHLFHSFVFSLGFFYFIFLFLKRLILSLVKQFVKYVS